MSNPSFETSSSSSPDDGNFYQWDSWTEGSDSNADSVDISHNAAAVSEVPTASSPYVYDFHTPHGSYAAYILTHLSHTSYIYQTLTTTPGGIYALSYSYYLAHAVLNTTSSALRADIRYALNVTFADEPVDLVYLSPQDVRGGWATRQVTVTTSGKSAELALAWGIVDDNEANSIFSELGLDEVTVTLKGVVEDGC